MSLFEFNSIFVIESLSGKLTGKDLYEDIIRRQSYYKYPDLKTKYFHIENKTDFLTILKTIGNWCVQEKCYPILHFEIHGDRDFKGLVLKSGELVDWKELYDILLEINISIKNNLFLTLAVCYGAYLMKVAAPTINPAPFYAFIGSFDEILENDLILRYNEFYTEFFESLNINKALKKLHLANPDIPSTFCYIDVEQIFINIYKKHIDLSPKEKRERAHKALSNYSWLSLKEKNICEEKFIRSIDIETKKFYKEAHRAYFMIDKYPENKSRFNIPDTLDEFRKYIQDNNL